VAPANRYRIIASTTLVRRAGPAAVRHVRKQIAGAPATFCYLAVLCATTGVLAWMGHKSSSGLILAASSNLRHLTIDPSQALFSSAFWLASGFKELITWLVLFPMVLAPVERRLGTRHTIGTFAVGHIGATLVTQGMVAAAVWLRLAANRWENVPDVGASYGFIAVAALLFALVPRRWRVVYAIGLLGWIVAISHITQADFTTVGHGIALVIGLLAARGLRRHREAAGPDEAEAPVPGSGVEGPPSTLKRPCSTRCQTVSTPSSPACAAAAAWAKRTSTRSCARSASPCSRPTSTSGSPGSSPSG